jgi:hypothetical protein
MVLVALSKALAAKTKNMDVPPGKHPLDTELLIKIKGGISRGKNTTATKITMPWTTILAAVLAGCDNAIGQVKLVNLFNSVAERLVAGDGKLTKKETDWADRLTAEYSRLETAWKLKEERSKKKRWTSPRKGATTVTVEGSVLEVLSGRDIEPESEGEIIQIQTRSASG